LLTSVLLFAEEDSALVVRGADPGVDVERLVDACDVMGVWGGTSERQRRALRRNQRAD
jgi:hypothetical protein